MNIAAVSGWAWEHHREAAGRLIARLANAETGTTAVIDRAAVAREQAQMNDGHASMPTREIALSDWLEPGMVDGGVLDVHAVRSAPADIPVDHVVILDARSHRPELIENAFGHLRFAWFPLDEWHPAFVVVTDDIHLLSLAQTLARTFYCEPQLLTEMEMSRLIAQTMRRAAAFRWLGPGFVRWQEGLLYRVFRRYSAWAERREERVARQS